MCNIELNIENFAWTNKTTKLLLQKYYERKDNFRNPKIKKKLLWMEIIKEFKTIGYNVNEDLLDRKMRNLKQSYKSIKNNNKKTSTGRGRLTWEWYDTMEDIFKEDRTINVGPTLSSMTNINAINNFESSSTSSIPSTLTEEEVHNINTVHSDNDCALSEITENSSENRSQERYVKERVIGNSYIFDWLQNCVQINFHSYDIQNSNDDLDINVITNVKLREELFISYSPVPDTQSMQPSTKNIKEKATKSRALYKFRKMMLECEERRIDAINKLSEKIDEHNKIQQERNDILKRLISSRDDR